MGQFVIPITCKQWLYVSWGYTKYIVVITVEQLNRGVDIYRFNLLSLNVRGLRMETKRISIFQYIKRKNIDVCFLQETHSKEIDENIWRNEWGGEIYFSHGTNQARGVMILVRSGLDMTLTDIIIDNEGRYIYINIISQDTNFKLVNIYAPNLEVNQLKFFKVIRDLLDNVRGNEDRIILGGDFNVIFEPLIDRKGGNFQITNIYQQVIDLLDDMIDNNNLCDVWRVKHPDQKAFTWRQRRPEIHSRLDVWLISDSLQDFVTEVDIRPSIRSDHSAILLKLDSFKIAKGSGYWKLNNSFIDEYDYIQLIINNFHEWNVEVNDINDNRIKWEYIKYKIRMVSIEYGKKRKKRLDFRQNKLEEELHKAYRNLDSNGETDEEANRRLELEVELKELDTYKTEGLILRSKCRWFEKGEKSNNYFLRLINNNRVKITMNKLQTEEGVIETNPLKILDRQAKFYENLYAEKENKNDREIEQYLENVNTPKLDDNEKEGCEGLITEEECSKVIKTFKKGKTPGNDGITIEFYCKFWHLINKTLIDSFNTSFALGELSETQKRGIITLLDKGKDRTLLKNWRPITLLNVDYKILSKTIAERIKIHLPKLINHNQVGYVKGRNIVDNIRTVSDLMFLTKKDNLGGIMIGIDFQKAFDSANWKFLMKTLKHYNFGTTLIKWIETLYRNSSSCIINNGRLSDIFKLYRGVRQGDPLSPYLFILLVEILAQIIRQDNEISGYQIAGNNLKILQYADDTVGCLADLGSAKQFLKQVHIFGSFSGLMLNKDKTEGMWLGSDRLNRRKPLGISWPDKPIRILGIYLSYDEDSADQLNFEEKINKCKQILNSWKSRKLTFYGRNQIIKTFIISQFLYTASAIDIPEKYIRDIGSIIFNFIWNGKKPKLKREIMTKTNERGGINVPDFSIMIQTSLIKWIRKFNDDNNHSWKSMLRHFVGRAGIGNIDIFMKANYVVKDTDLSINLPKFYLKVFNVWKIFGNVEGGKNSIIWYNENFRINRKSFILEDFANVGLFRISDLFDEQGTVFSFANIVERGVSPHRWLAWHSLLACVLKKHDIVSEYKESVHESSRLCLGNSLLCEITSKKSYGLLHEQKYGVDICRPRIANYCDNIDVDVDWSKYFISLKSVQDTRSREFQFKIFHDIHVNNYWLSKWGIKDSEICSSCNLIRDDISHMFWECQSLNVFMINFKNFIQRMFDCNLTKEIFLLGNDNVLMNQVLIICKQTIYTCKLKNEPVLMEKFMYSLKLCTKIEFEIAKGKNSVEQYLEKWGIMLVFLEEKNCPV